MIPVNRPLLNGREKELLLQCIDTGWISSDGPFVAEFERRFAEYIGVRHGITVSNGTVALETALFAAGIGKGDEVIMPSFTIISCALAAVRLGAVPVLVDADPETWNMDATQIESKITSRTKAIMVVHMYGHPVEMVPVMEIAHKYNLTVVEDAAEAHGAEYRNKRCGSIGHIAAFSFYANKIITTGEGGMVLTSDGEMAQRARSYRNLYFDAERRYYHAELANNYRMTNLQAAIGIAQMERIDEFIRIKRQWGAYYKERLDVIKGIKTQVEKPWAKMVYWMYCIELDNSLCLDAAGMIAALKQKGIGARHFFTGLHKQPALRRMGLFEHEAYPVTDRLSARGLYLPSGLALEQGQVDDVVAAVRAILSGHGQ